jgi:hypothetical protein
MISPLAVPPRCGAQVSEGAGRRDGMSSRGVPR